MRTARRKRHYIAHRWLLLLRPVFRYSHSRDAYVLRAVGATVGPVLRIDRRHHVNGRFDGVDRRRAGVA
jgi:hypothetical protein